MTQHTDIQVLIHLAMKGNLTLSNHLPNSQFSQAKQKAGGTQSQQH